MTNFHPFWTSKSSSWTSFGNQSSFWTYYGRGVPCRYDQTLSLTHMERWKGITEAINKAITNQTLTVSRSYFGSINANWNLHVFCDASRRAYGAVAYLTYKKQVAIVMAKARLTPLKGDDKELTIPEAELTAATIGTRVADTIVASLKVLNIRLTTTLWSDAHRRHVQYSCFQKIIKRLLSSLIWFTSSMLLIASSI